MSTKTLRPLKKGDLCYVRIQRRGKPVLAVYVRPFGNEKQHWVEYDGRYFACSYYYSMPYDANECIFVAKPVGEKTEEIGQ